MIGRLRAWDQDHERVQCRLSGDVAGQGLFRFRLGRTVTLSHCAVPVARDWDMGFRRSRL